MEDEGAVPLSNHTSYVVVDGDKMFQSEYIGEFLEPGIALSLELLEPKQGVALDVEQVEVVPGEEEGQVITCRNYIVEDDAGVEFGADELLCAGVDGLCLVGGFGR